MRFKPQLRRQCFLDCGSQLFLAPRGTDEQLLTRTGAQRDRLPSVLRWYRDADLNLAFGVANRTDHTGNDRADFRARRQQPFQHVANPVDDAVLDLELALRGTLTERRH